MLLLQLSLSLFLLSISLSSSPLLSRFNLLLLSSLTRLSHSLFFLQKENPQKRTKMQHRMIHINSVSHHSRSLSRSYSGTLHYQQHYEGGTSWIKNRGQSQTFLWFVDDPLHKKPSACVCLHVLKYISFSLSEFHALFSLLQVHELAILLPLLHFYSMHLFFTVSHFGEIGFLKFWMVLHIPLQCMRLKVLRMLYYWWTNHITPDSNPRQIATSPKTYSFLMITQIWLISGNVSFFLCFRLYAWNLNI